MSEQESCLDALQRATERGYFDDRFEHGDWWNRRVLEDRVQLAAKGGRCPHNTLSVRVGRVYCMVCKSEVFKDELKGDWKQDFAKERRSDEQAKGLLGV